MSIAIDFETFYSKKLKYGLTSMIAEEYARHDLFDCYLVSVSDGTTTWAGHPREFNWSALNGQTLLSHNRFFDNSIYNELVRRGLAPHMQFKQWHCTANLTSFLCNRRALADAAEHLFKQKVDKSYRGVADGKQWPQDYTEAERKQVIESGRVDAHTCWNLFDKFGDQWPTQERRLSDITIDQGMRGVQINVQLLENYIDWTHEARTKTEQVIPWISEAAEEWEEFSTKPTSSKCIAEQCRRVGIPCPPLKSEDEEGYEEWEAQHHKQHRWIKAVSSWRSINKLYATFVTVKRRLRQDGTLPFALKYFGAHTGRWSGDAKINFQNMRKKPLLITQEGLMESDERLINAAIEYKRENKGEWPSWVKCAVDFRALVIPRPGKKMIVSDLAQIEPRVLAYLGGNHELLKKISGGMGVYEAFARTSMGFTGDKIDKKSDYYKMIKIQVLGLGYGAGWEKFISIAMNEGGIDLCKDDPEFVTVVNQLTGEVTQKPGFGETSRKIVEGFRKAVPSTTNLWKRLDAEFKSSVGDKFVMHLPSGRKLTYEDVRASVTLVPDPDTGKVKREYRYSAAIGGRRVDTYGGKLTENITQAVARDVFGYHVVNLEDKFGAGSNLFSAHDEAVLEVDQSVTAKDVEHQMSQCPEWIKGLPVAAEASEVSHYTK